MVKLTILGPKPGSFFKSPNESYKNFVQDAHQYPNTVLYTEKLQSYNDWLQIMFTPDVTPNPNNPYSKIYLDMMSRINKHLEAGETVECLVGGSSGVDTIFGIAALTMMKQHPGKVSISVYNYAETAEKSGIAMHQQHVFDYDKYVATGSTSSDIVNIPHVKARRMIDKYASKTILPDRYNYDNPIVQITNSNYKVVRDADEVVVVSTGHTHGSRTATAIRTSLKLGKEVSVINSAKLQFEVGDALQKIPSKTAHLSKEYGFVEKLLPEYFDKKTKKYNYTQQRLDGKYFDRPWNPSNDILPEHNSKPGKTSEGYVYHSKWGLLDNKKNDSLNYVIENEALYISGSNRHSTLSENTKKILDNAMARDLDILVTDTRGIDRTIQEYLKLNNYKNVKIYTVFSEVKNQLDSDWDVRYIPLTKDLDLKDYVHTQSVAPKRSLYNVRDFQMAKDATEAYCIVNSSERALGNEAPHIHTAFRMVMQDKPVIVEDYNMSKTVTIDDLTIPSVLAKYYKDFKSEFNHELTLFDHRSETTKPLNHDQLEIKETPIYDL